MFVLKQINEYVFLVSFCGTFHRLFLHMGISEQYFWSIGNFPHMPLFVDWKTQIQTVYQWQRRWGSHKNDVSKQTQFNFVQKFFNVQIKTQQKKIYFFVGILTHKSEILEQNSRVSSSHKTKKKAYVNIYPDISGFWVQLKDFI
jgi:hypothetical protein